MMTAMTYMAWPQTVIAAAETSAPTECAFTSLKLPQAQVLKHQDVLTNSTMLHTWGVLQTKSIRVHYLTRCLGGSKIQRNVKWNVTRRDISTLLGRGEANAFVAILYVSNEKSKNDRHTFLSLSLLVIFYSFSFVCSPLFSISSNQSTPRTTICMDLREIAIAVGRLLGQAKCVSGKEIQIQFQARVAVAISETASAQMEGAAPSLVGVATHLSTVQQHHHHHHQIAFFLVCFVFNCHISSAVNVYCNTLELEGLSMQYLLQYRAIYCDSRKIRVYT